MSGVPAASRTSAIDCPAVSIDLDAPRRAELRPMQTLLLTHPAFLRHETGPLHPERPARMRAIDAALAAPAFAALRAVGAGLRAVDAVMDPASGVANAFCQVRPPGHHAERDRAMGSCLFSTAAIDFDVHHGNGTQDIVWADAACLGDKLLIGGRADQRLIGLAGGLRIVGARTDQGDHSRPVPTEAAQECSRLQGSA